MTSTVHVPGPEPELGLRERKKRATRAALQHAALEIASTDGLEALTIEAITARADVSPRTFFNYFATKEEALTAPDPDSLERLTTHLHARPVTEDPFTSLRAIFLDDAARVTATKETWRLRMHLAANHPGLFNTAISANAKLETTLAEILIDRGRGTCTRSQALLATSLALAVRRTALRIWVHAEFAESFHDVMVQCFADTLNIVPRTWG